MACHNRRETTLNCLRHLYDQDSADDMVVETFLVDDGSTDGTAGAVRSEFPDVTLIEGDGTLFWCGGMRKAWEQAARQDPDAYLLLNDDVSLQPEALVTLLEVYGEQLKRTGQAAVVVGSCNDPDTGNWTYGGSRCRGGKRSLDFEPVIPDGTVQECDIMNGNCVLVPRAVYNAIGGLSGEFTHAIGDFDYGWRAQDAGFPLLVPGRYVGQCHRNACQSWCDPSTPVRVRLKLLYAPLGLNLREYLRFYRKHLGSPWRAWVKAYLRALSPRLHSAMKHAFRSE
jgi:GT2 family glycosyltransferase